MRSTSGGILYDQPIVNRLASSFWPIRAMLPTNIGTFGCRTLGNRTVGCHGEVKSAAAFRGGFEEPGVRS